MKKLDRNLALSPNCLKNYSHTSHTWRNLKSVHKRSIWNQLYKMQGRFCAYCESPAERGNGHLEHFYNKGNPSFRNRTFDWHNLFSSCDKRNCCGHYKDRTLPGGVPNAYDPLKLIKPDVDDPSAFLKFLTTGSVVPQGELSEDDMDRATETIVTFNLTAPSLITSRKAQIKRYTKQLNALDDLAAYLTDEEFQKEYAAIKESSEKSMHATAVAQVLFN